MTGWAPRYAGRWGELVMRSDAAKIGYDWPLSTVGEICDDGGGNVQTGPFGSQLHASDYVVDGIPSVMPQDLSAGRITTESVARITSEDRDRLIRYALRVGDVVYARRGDLRRRALVGQQEEGWLCGTGCLRVRPGDACDQRFLYYALGHPPVQDWIDRHSVGATMPNLNTEILRSCPVPRPPRAAQERIAAVLGALDDKIDSNRRLAGLLEETAAALFKARFVDFVGVEDFEDSEVGPIPVGWRVGSLVDIARFVNGKAFTKDAAGSGRPILRIRELNGGVDTQTLRGELSAADDHMARADDILFAWSGSLGVYRWPGQESLINQHIFKVIPQGFPGWYVYGWIAEYMDQFRRTASDRAVTMGHIKREHLSAARLAIPGDADLQAADSAITPLDQQRAALVAEQQTLTELRDALLPKLISGAIRVPETPEVDEVIGPLVEATS